MICTVNDVIGLEVMNLAQVRTARSALPVRTVESVSVIEIPVENFVRKNEFVLSTAIGCNHDANVFRNFVQEIIDSEAAALAIATGRHVLEIPQEVIETAEKHDFPIIEIPWEVRFADITNAVIRRLEFWQRTSLQRSEELQKQLLGLFLREATLFDAAEMIGQAVGSPVLIADSEGFIKGKSSDADELADQWHIYFRSQIRGNLNQTGSSLNRIGSNPNQTGGSLWNTAQADHQADKWAQLLEGSIIQLKIQSANKFHGYLITKLNPATSLEAFQTSGEQYVLEHALTAAALWFQRESAIQETELRLRDDFVWSLAKGEIDSWDKVLSRAKTLNLNVTRPYVCILGLPENLKPLYDKHKAVQTPFDQWSQSIIRTMEEQLADAGRAIQRQTMITFHEDRFIIYLEVPLNQVNETVKLYLDRVDARLGDLLPELIVSWGIGENHAGIKTFQESYNDARIALQIGTKQKGPGHRSTYANTEIYRALLSLAQNPDTQQMTLSTLGALIDYDQQRGLDLLNTLVVYIRNQGNVSQTSRVLSLHRQSLLYRLKKIESITGRSLEDPDDLFLLDLSIKLWMTGMLLNQKEKDYI